MVYDEEVKGESELENLFSFHAFETVELFFEIEVSLKLIISFTQSIILWLVSSYTYVLIIIFVKIFSRCCAGKLIFLELQF